MCVSEWCSTVEGEKRVAMQECKYLHVDEQCSAVEFNRPPTARCLLKLTSQCHAFCLVFVGFIRVKSIHMFRSYHRDCNYSKTLFSYIPWLDFAYRVI